MTKRIDIAQTPQLPLGGEPIGLIGPMRLMRPIGLISLISLIGLIFPISLMAQEDPEPAPIIVGGNIYGGGNRAVVEGNTTVNVRGGDLNMVFGGARMANVGGRSFVYIDGEHANDYRYAIINYVYGGNDIAGTIGTSKYLPKALTDTIENRINNTWNSFVRVSTKTTTNETTGKVEEVDGAKKIYIGQLFAGGNGAYDRVVRENYPEDGVTTYEIYEKTDVDHTTPIAFNTTDFIPPTLAKTYLEIEGGSIVYAYGGGNNATVTEKTVIHVDNPSEVVNSVVDERLLTDNINKTINRTDPVDETDPAKGELLTMSRFRYEMGINTGLSKPSSDEFQIGRLFGGNNQAEMAIRPTWNLLSGKVRNLYSGGNKGAMTYKEGLLLEIPETSTIVVDNLFGGCRMADVHPLLSGTLREDDDDNPANVAVDIHLDEIVLHDDDGNTPWNFPTGLTARLLVRGGDINNIYGGNDVTGHVRGGNAVGVYTSVRGDVYGGGNGAYPYTDNWYLRNQDSYGELYYGERTKTESHFSSPTYSLRALNDFRPDAEQVSIRLLGKDEAHPTIIGGSVFLGGNSATITGSPEIANPLVQLKIGSYVIANNVFMGNNGEYMADLATLRTMADTAVPDDDYEPVEDGDSEEEIAEKQSHLHDFSIIDLTDRLQMSTYMEGVAMPVKPSGENNFTFDYDASAPNDPQKSYQPYTSQIGSLFCGGNVGSMTYPGTQTMNLNAAIIIFEKLVGGCNNADVPYREGLNAAYEGGVLGHIESGTESDESSYIDDDGNIKDRLVMNLDGLRIMPKRWDDTFTKVANGTTLTAGKAYYTTDLRASKFIADGTEVADDTNKKYYYELTEIGSHLVWNTVKWDEDDTDNRFLAISTDNSSEDKVRRLFGGNIYGGCYNSGHINGNVIINIDDELMSRYGDTANGLEGLFADATEDPNDEDKLIIDSNGARRSGVILDNQRDDLMSVALSVFGAGCGDKTEIWGSSTVNLNKGYAFQVFGGGEEGYVGRGASSKLVDDNEVFEYDDEGYIIRDYTDSYTSAYSSTVNMDGLYAGYSETETGMVLAEAEYLYGGGNEGDVCGNSYVYLGNGRIYDAFGGASNADIFGHSEVYIGKNSSGERSFPWVRDIVYGGNDFGGTIRGAYEQGYDFTARVRNYDEDKNMLYGLTADASYTDEDGIPKVLKSSSYVEYLEGHADTIFGGCYGNYDYSNPMYYDDEGHPAVMPYLASSFVNIRPMANSNNALKGVFGGGTGYPDYREGDKSQDRSYVLIDIPDDMDNFRYTDIYGSGSYNGMGMREKVLPMSEVAAVDPVEPMDDPGEDATDEEKAAYAAYQAYKAYEAYKTYQDNLNDVSSIIDLVRGKVGIAYGGSYNEGITRRTVVNVPEGSTIDIGAIFGGAYGNVTLDPCDVYEANVNYHSEDAWLNYNPLRTETTVEGDVTVGNEKMKGAIYGGNNQQRRTLYAKVNIDAPVNQKNYKYGTSKGYIYGAGCGHLTWAEYTEVNLKAGAEVWEVYGGGEDGLVINAPSIQKYINQFYTAQGVENYTDAHWKTGWILGSGYDTGIEDEFTSDHTTTVTVGNTSQTIGTSTFYENNTYTNLNNPLVTPRAEFGGKRFNTNVIISRDAYVGNYAYGGGLGHRGVEQSGNVYGNTYITLLGGTVNKDIYAAGSTGAIFDLFGVGAYDADYNPFGFTAGTTAYIEGGTCRNVYGGGWEGSVGGTSATGEEISGTTDVMIGIRPEFAATTTDFYQGVPAIQRNAYAGGEGGSVIGTANITVNNGYIGYAYLPAGKNFGALGAIVDDDTKTEPWYAEKIDDETNWQQDVWKGEKSLKDCGNVYGSGYDDLSSVDISNVTLHGGIIRNCVFGGGEIALVGRGTRANATAAVNITKPGQTNVNIYGGHVLRNVYGGGKGYNTLGYGGGHNKFTDGYVFGQTHVNIYGGEIGTETGVLEADEPGDVGNVFGGGDAGFVYSAYELSDGTIAYGQKSGTRYDGGDEGYYYKSNGTSFIDDNGTVLSGNAEKHMTEDCKVLVEPHAKVLTDVTIGDDTYTKGSYVPTSVLNTLKDRETDAAYWNKLDDTGIIIYNAVFAGGNIASVSQMYADIPSVFGNATASIHDTFHRDLITIGTGKVGGLYGDGNLTLVDGYRELNITNYGTDYYYITKKTGDNKEIGINEYNQLFKPREKNYFEVKYRCLSTCTDKDGTTYTEGSTLLEDELKTRFAGTEILEKLETAETSWSKIGKMSNYAGRLLSTIQRADFCGIFGSRMIMKGAKDRLVSSDVDDNDYTINRVREVSLNKKTETVSSGSAPRRAGETPAMHGNYFGIYNTVNYLGALTSDFDFGDENTRSDIRKTDNNTKQNYYDVPSNNQTYGNASFYDWKKEFHDDPRRNNGLSHNQVALASGVSLEILTEQSTGKGLYEKDWGPITGVVQLDLINVAASIGGGYVYAQNIHGQRKATGKTQTLLTDLNKADATTGKLAAATMKSWEYIETNPSITGISDPKQLEFQTSGNFVHNMKTIIDDCYNKKNHYLMTDADRVPAHYWYITGTVYIYDQVISAYTGSPHAYSESVDIPLTITTASHGKLKLVDVQPNLYALYSDGTNKTKLTAGAQIVINDVTYNLNDPISYWEWSNLPESEQGLFVPETYVNCVDVCIDGETTTDGEKVIHPAGTYVMTADEWASFIPQEGQQDHIYTDADGDPIRDGDYEVAGTGYVFRPSNNISHDNGYALTYQMNNPSIWDTWYTPSSGSASNKNQTGGNGYEAGPTYHPSAAGLYGQMEYGLSDIISEDVFEKYEDYTVGDDGTISKTENRHGLRQDHADAITATGNTQATFERAYITTAYVETTNKDDIDQHLQEGAKLALSQYEGDGLAALSGKVAPAYVSTTTIQLGENAFIYPGDLMTSGNKTTYTSQMATAINTLVRGKITTVTDERLAAIRDGAELTTEEKTALGATDVKKLMTLVNTKADIEQAIVPAYYCISEGYYGGDYYDTSRNYPALETLNAMSGTDFEKFKNGFNYDALDLLIDPTYARAEGEKYQYDGNYTTAAEVRAEDTGNPAGYSVTQSVDYAATYTGTVDLWYTPDADRVVNSADLNQNGQVNANTAAYNELSTTEYESLQNEQYHYTPITVPDGGGTFYVVNTAFYYNEPYAVGQLLDPEIFDALPHSTTQNLQNNVTTLTFDDQSEFTWAAGTYYYCRDSYTIDLTNGHKVKNIIDSDIYDKGEPVPVGAIIAKENDITSGTITSYGYSDLTNQQKDFTIHGIAPVEKSTLYVTRNSDIKDLSKEKIITVVYQYDYEESDNEYNITPISEPHVVNIHIRFVNGEPYVADIEAPGIVLPGTSVIPEAPSVVAGGYLITGRGWEIYENEDYAKSHINGIEYVSGTDPLYWYQDGYQIAYYAKTYLGKYYSNYVPLSVANYHRMDDVLNITTNEETGDTEIETDNHYMYLNQAVKSNKRDPKVYIQDDNELKKFAAFYNETRAKSELSDVKDGQNIDFIIDGNISHSGEWTSIGAEGCFEGTLHGDGYTITGLDNSLFNKLCGDIYNLGVTGTFTGAGIAESGSGYVENGWISTSSTAAKTSQPVFGNPTRTQETFPNDLIQIVNSYYQEEKDDAFEADGTTPKEGSYTKKITDRNDSDHGTPTRKPTAAFYNGEVAYNLNSFYLNKRFYNQQTLSEDKKVAYQFLQRDDDGQLKETADEGYYPKDKTDYAQYVDLGYVEERYADGDFRYAGGVIPTDKEPRERTTQKTTSTTTTDPETGEEITTTTTTDVPIYLPIWPEDYLFFGQSLTFGYDNINRVHQSVPSHFSNMNRVYRAPAYYRNSTMSTVHFNPDAILAAKENLTEEQIENGVIARDAYPGMTAVDFAGHNDLENGYKQGLKDGKFYQPLLDDDGLTGIMNADETRNLLVYAPASTSASGYANEATYNVLTGYFTDPAYALHSDESGADGAYHDNKVYKRVASASITDIHGHLVQNDFTAINDHLLVDKNDFYAPMSYQFADSYRMWYQRVPDHYADITWADGTRTSTGWEGVSIPFEADLVTTDEKGEITHFYRKDVSGTYERDYDSGHEYWLRGFEGVANDNTATTDIIEATFLAPLKSSAEAKTVSNTFLWDYYYSKNNTEDDERGRDKNEDKYQREYYKDNHRKYTGYTRLASGTPYIIGFPGDRYYEFDLSGEFRASTALTTIPAPLKQQTITFVSKPGITIAESDAEMTGVTPTGSAYTFKPSYLNEELEAGTNYVLNNDGDAYTQLSDKVVTWNTTSEAHTFADAAALAAWVAEHYPLYTDEAGTTEATTADNTEVTYYKRESEKTTVNDNNNVTPLQHAFRPYFIGPNGGNAPRRIIVSGGDNTSLKPDVDERHNGDANGGLKIAVEGRNIIVESTRRDDTTVRIVSASGITITTFTIEPGQIISTPVDMTGVYIVNRTKVVVK